MLKAFDRDFEVKRIVFHLDLNKNFERIIFKIKNYRDRDHFQFSTFSMIDFGTLA